MITWHFILIIRININVLNNTQIHWGDILELLFAKWPFLSISFSLKRFYHYSEAYSLREEYDKEVASRPQEEMEDCSVAEKGLLGREMKTDHFRGIRKHVLPKHATFMLLYALITLGMGNQKFSNFPKYIMFLEFKKQKQKRNYFYS